MNVPDFRYTPLLAMLLTLPGTTTAAVITPTVVAGSQTAAAFTLGSIPGGFSVGIDVGTLPTSQTQDDATNADMDTTDGAARATLDSADINMSSVGARSFVGTDAAGTVLPPASPVVRNLSNLSFGAFGATLSTVGLDPGGTGQVDSTLQVDGSFIFTDLAGMAGESVESVDEFGAPIFIPDVSGSVSVLMSLSDELAGVGALPDGSPDLDSLTVAPLFNGSLTLESIAAGGVPVLSMLGDFAMSDYTIVPGCSAFFCQIDVLMSRTFLDVQSLGFGDVFELGALVFTNAEMLRAPGRSLDVDFLNTASVAVSVTPVTAVPEPGTLTLAGLAFAGLWAGFRRRA